MKIRLITVSEIREFIQNEFEHFRFQLPITPERAASQAMNPHAKPGDPCLLLALGEADVLLGYLGVLPLGEISAGARLFGTSCWWVDPLKGRGAAMPLFYRMMDLTQGNLLFFDLTGQTAGLLGNLGAFYLFPEKEGVYGWFRSGFTRRHGKTAGFDGAVYYMLATFDLLFNLITGWRIRGWLRKIRLEEDQIRVLCTPMPDEETGLFLQKLAEENFLIRTKQEIEWILSKPWIIQVRKPHEPRANYAFSWHANSFETSCLKVSSDSGVIGFAIVTNRDGICKVPLMYALSGQGEKIAAAVLQNIIESGAHGIISWNADILHLINNSAMPFIRRRKAIKRMAVAEKLRNEIPNEWQAQDGDGDGIFT
ncbi:MAG: hypothetical protein U0T82_17585 [Bacteroidales bacterium]